VTALPSSTPTSTPTEFLPPTVTFTNPPDENPPTETPQPAYP
jgi:hypothetical protein